MLPGSSADFAKFICDETAKWAKVIHDAKIGGSTPGVSDKIAKRQTE